MLHLHGIVALLYFTVPWQAGFLPWVGAPISPVIGTVYFPGIAPEITAPVPWYSTMTPPFNVNDGSTLWVPGGLQQEVTSCLTNTPYPLFGTIDSTGDYMDGQ